MINLTWTGWLKHVFLHICFIFCLLILELIWPKLVSQFVKQYDFGFYLQRLHERHAKQLEEEQTEIEQFFDSECDFVRML